MNCSQCSVVLNQLQLLSRGCLLLNSLFNSFAFVLLSLLFVVAAVWRIKMYIYLLSLWYNSLLCSRLLPPLRAWDSRCSVQTCCTLPRRLCSIISLSGSRCNKLIFSLSNRVGQVKRSDYIHCTLGADSWMKMILNCSEPHKRRRFTILFEPYQSIPRAPEYHPGGRYYFISK